MTPFEFLAIAISVIFGLAISRLISGIGLAFRQIKSKKYYWLHGIWMVNMLILLSANWWSLYAWSKFENWNIIYFGLLIIYTISLFLISDFLVPQKLDNTLNTKEYFNDNKTYFLVLVLISLVVDFFETRSLANLDLRPIPKGQLLVSSLLSSILIINLLVKKDKLNYVFSVSFGLILITYLIFGIFLIR